jgi:hypothetical protein
MISVVEVVWSFPNMGAFTLKIVDERKPINGFGDLIKPDSLAQP